MNSFCQFILETADAKVRSKEEKEALRRKQLKQIKKKFGLEVSATK
jgi:hypothetical protein